MKAFDFIEKLENILNSPIDISIYNPFLYYKENFDVYMEFLPDDFSLYIQLKYNDIIYYYHFNEKFTKCEEYDTVLKTVKIEIAEDILEKIDSLVNNKPFDDRISIPLDFNKKELHQLMLMAHEHDMSLNKFIEYLLLKYMDDKELQKYIKSSSK
ncbi:MAG: RHH-like transcriptional regulator [Caudoviricetes sp.]|nr:MAG: RHH-like transcriptional regulator [Caudoviricetes sp.]